MWCNILFVTVLSVIQDLQTDDQFGLFEIPPVTNLSSNLKDMFFFVYTEPSTNRASLNFQEALSRPPLNRSHLHFPAQEGSPALASSSLFSQPSTSTTSYSGNPFAVALNFSLVKEIKDNSSQHEDDNISTTSGFSSRASDKGEVVLKTGICF